MINKQNNVIINNVLLLRIIIGKVKLINTYQVLRTGPGIYYLLNKY